LSVLGIGTDIVAVARVSSLLRRHRERFLTRCFQPLECQQFSEMSEQTLAASVAGRWAAKEALLKALGGNIRHIPYGDICVARGSAGEPILSLQGIAAAEFRTRGGGQLHLTISHEREFAVATVLLETG